MVSGCDELLREFGSVGGHRSCASAVVYLRHYSVAQGEVVHRGVSHPLPNSVWDEQDSIRVPHEPRKC